MQDYSRLALLPMRDYSRLALHSMQDSKINLDPSPFQFAVNLTSHKNQVYILFQHFSCTAVEVLANRALLPSLRSNTGKLGRPPFWRPDGRSFAISAIVAVCFASNFVRLTVVSHFATHPIFAFQLQRHHLPQTLLLPLSTIFLSRRRSPIL
jgi:hypothetical protein